MDTQYWIAVVGGVAVLLLAVLLVRSIARRRRPDVVAVLRAAALETAHDILLPNGMGGQIHIEYLLLTAQGLVVVDTKQFVGTIFGGDRMDEWTVIGPQRRFTFPNPQTTLYDRIAAVRRLARDIPVHGHVLFSAGADFSGGRPREVILAEEFAALYAKPDKSEVEALKDALRPQWEAVRQAFQPA